jgi:hypothetical protein
VTLDNKRDLRGKKQLCAHSENKLREVLTQCCVNQTKRNVGYVVTAIKGIIIR